MTTTTTHDPTAVSFRELLQTQRWDDHRYYHHSRVNQTLHLISALSFLCAYVCLFFDPVLAAFLGWCVSMVTRQSGHFFFEPLGYDHVNQCTHSHKEAIKVGYNLARKVVLLSAWAASTLVPWASPTLFGVYDVWQGWYGYAHHVAVLWITLGAVAVVGRGIWLAVNVQPRQGVAWVVKILTDPFHDVKIYWKAPLHLLRGQWLDPMTDWPEPMRRL